ncbi:RNAse P Rpr2/Rpp21/SNM1 subunit domain-containing protein [Chaetomium tenue]|uniref:RNAse P Rpr2/Rpp21/SNM1 subunit domain-containing protein n=1 Tax=Chaetomium tenue TaxID=1854479 RepID=A0ACB7P8F2_9PEZI|nr:RNAse P Rpr2/Rpp21/SNM1 subunit domain-containing protein [Chaetomium globosum]
MAKGKAGGSVQNRAVYSRISFLQQAAITLSAIPCSPSDPGSARNTNTNTPSTNNHLSSAGDTSDTRSVKALDGMSRRLATDLRAVSLKTRIRLKPTVKQSICKFCDSTLIDGQSCTSEIENKSKGAKKPWADVLVRRCHTCGRERRYPLSATRPKRKTERGLEKSTSHLQEQNQEG